MYVPLLVSVAAVADIGVSSVDRLLPAKSGHSHFGCYLAGLQGGHWGSLVKNGSSTQFRPFDHSGGI